MLRHETMTTDYLGETIKLALTEYGWRSWWLHPVMGAFGDGMDYPSYELALSTAKDLIQRSAAIDELLVTIDEWQDLGLLAEEEHNCAEASLLGFIVY